MKPHIFRVKNLVRLPAKVCAICCLYLVTLSATVTEISAGATDKSDLRLYFFGHSLIAHAFPKNSSVSDETAVPYWMAKLAEVSDTNYTANGQFGFLLQHANLPPQSQWGFNTVASSWDPMDNLSESQRAESFAGANFTDIVITAANFIQYQSPDESFDGDNPQNKSPVTATLEIIDWLTTKEPGVDIYIYENWPDMASYGSHPINRGAFERYNKYVIGDFHDWWLDYCDQLQTSRPSVGIKMIPVGPIIAGLVTETPLRDIDISELYEDDAPHGQPNIYFLASLITYMAITGNDELGIYQPPMSIHQLIRDNMTLVISYIQTKLKQHMQNKKCQF